ncbi:MAG TPA: cytochrome c3 family protein [Dermatophilaceae bacterium]
MKKFLFLGIGTALMFTMGGVGTAQADNGQHISTAQGAGVVGGLVNNAGARCASCHRAHTAKAEYLLKVAQPQLCYSCHADGGGASTNVVSGVVMNTAKALRGGGFEKALIGSALATKDTGAVDPATGRIATSNQTVPVLAAGVTTTSKHLIDGVTAGTAYGNGTDASGAGKSLTLECGSCHDPHGNGNYRVLRPIPVDSGYASHQIKAAIPAVVDNPATPLVDETAAAVPAVMSPAAGIKIPDATSYKYDTANYWLSGDSLVPVDPTATLTGTPKTGDLAADGYINNIANWCTTCHTRYQAVSGSYKTARAGTNTAGQDTNFTYQHRSDANYKGAAANCITCHVSHGSNATMNGAALTVANPGAALTAFGDATTSSADSKLLRVDNRGTCFMCHNV